MSKNKKGGGSPHAKTILRICGLLLLLFGIALTVAGAVLVRGGSPLWYIMFVGIPIMIVGVFLFVFSFQREVVRYVTTEQLSEPEMIPGSALTAYPAPAEEATVVCCCGEVNPAGSLFCRKCGRSLRVACPSCGAFVPCDGDYCTKCGAPLNGDKNNTK